MSEADPPEADPIGYGKPPRGSRFRKGQSGNPRGRPRGGRKDAPYEAVLGQRMVVRVDGVERRVTAAEAFLLHLTKRGLDGDGGAARATLAALEGARASRRLELRHPIAHTIVYVRPGSVNMALCPLRMATKLDRHRPTARMALEPWLVEAALKRLGSRRLTLAEQDEVVRATRTPHKVKWPVWWGVKG